MCVMLWTSLIFVCESVVLPPDYDPQGDWHEGAMLLNILSLPGEQGRRILIKVNHGKVIHVDPIVNSAVHSFIHSSILKWAVNE